MQISSAAGRRGGRPLSPSPPRGAGSLSPPPSPLGALRLPSTPLLLPSPILPGIAGRARDKERAARHQAARATSTPSSPSSPMAPVEEEVPPSRTCRRCGLPCRGHPAPGPGEGRCQVTLATTTPLPLEILREDNHREEALASPSLNTTREEFTPCPSVD